MILVVPGQDAVTSVLSYDDKFRHLLPFLNGDEDFESKMKKSVSSRYAEVLLNLMFLHSNKMEFCERFSTQLQAIPKKGRWTCPKQKFDQKLVKRWRNNPEFAKTEHPNVRIL